MAQIDERQRGTAESLAGKVKATIPNRYALWNLSGPVGSGKSSVMRLVAKSLRDQGLVPVVVSAPADEVDSAAIALLTTASRMKEENLLNGELITLTDPRQPWSAKLDALTGALDAHFDRVVLLCDEPGRWYRPSESTLDDTPDYCARSYADWIVKETNCRRVVSGWVSGFVQSDRRVWAPRLDDGRTFLAENGGWGEAAQRAESLRWSFSEPITGQSILGMKLGVALCHFQAPSEVIAKMKTDIPADVLLSTLLDCIEADAGHRLLREALVRLTMARTTLSETVFIEMTRDLTPLNRDLIRHCLLDWQGRQFALHPLVRSEIIARTRDPRRWEMKQQWRLRTEERESWHRRLKGEYPLHNGSAFCAQLESLHHDLLSGNPSFSDSDERLHFVEQLHEVGRTLSYVFHHHQRAAEIFRIALRFDLDHPYSHHYLAFNLDWLAKDSAQVENHYQAAIRLQPTHPWWWSRWISYLATRGRFREARAVWREALDSMSVSRYGTPRWLFLSLHRWVARWLLHWAELDFAEEVLRSIPTELAESDMSIQVLWSLLTALREAERGVAVFPLTVAAKDWWSHNPHTDLPLTWRGEPLRSWQPARVQSVDDDSDLVFLVGANRPQTAVAKLEYVEIELTRDQLASAAHQFQPDELREGSFVEIGRYAGSQLRISLHRATEWRDPQLLPLVPPPNRWFERAVEEAWTSKQEAV